MVSIVFDSKKTLQYQMEDVRRNSKNDEIKSFKQIRKNYCRILTSLIGVSEFYIEFFDIAKIKNRWNNRMENIHCETVT